MKKSNSTSSTDMRKSNLAFATGLFVLSLIALFFVTSCKKGENDPGVSLRSRDARLVGEWTLSAVSLSTTVKDFASSAEITDARYTRSETYNGTIWTETTTVGVGGTPNVSTDSYSLTMTLDKDGNATFKEVNDGRSREAINDWFWLDSKKNKSEVFVGGYNTKRFDQGTYEVDRLSNKELILTYTYWDKDIDSNGDGDETMIEETWTFVQN